MSSLCMRCNTCGEYIYKGKKFNARKETVEGEDYYGIKIFRFYIKCTLCSAEITFKTDPKNTDYAAEHGASRNFEPWREEKAVEEEDKLARLEEEENNPMKALENRQVDAKREMDVLDALQDIRARNARNERVGHSVDLAARVRVEDVREEENEEKRRAEEEDERRGAGGVREDTRGGGGGVRIRIRADDVEPDLESLLPEETRQMISSTKIVTRPLPVKKKINSLGIKIVKKPKVRA
ncbi:hypothetical protein EVG20_g9906 [Dentipellis fragilis]|uniref:Splicing factor YJU2 n=1 Tax=Dentipellis fragilis TaxID=205917 RepID=A0A4Y9XUK7_9AGAM|nr:hypothetical protein EVG20_g9906 [Dentipellis fragilis]